MTIRNPRDNITIDLGTKRIVTIFPPFPCLHGGILPDAIIITIEDIESVKGPSANVFPRDAVWAEEILDLVGKAEYGNGAAYGKLERPLRHN